jgi:hypothetical protein
MRLMSNSKKRAGKAILSVLLAVTALFTLTGTASAAVTVPPGGSGHTCSTYSHDTGNAGWYWQTCAWADNNEVYFTVNLGNTTNQNWNVDWIDIYYYSRGTNFTFCHTWTGFNVAAHSVTMTPTATCAYPRVRAAYAAFGNVEEGTYKDDRTSPSLQVQ